MKKNLFFVLCALLSLGFASCSHGNDIKEVTGTWSASANDVTYNFFGDKIPCKATYTVTFDDDAFVIKSKVKGTGGVYSNFNEVVTGKGTFKLEDSVLKFKMKTLSYENGDTEDVDDTFTYNYTYVDKSSFTLSPKSDENLKVFVGCDSKLTFTKE